jgi:hypothetical protein
MRKSWFEWGRALVGRLLGKPTPQLKVEETEAFLYRMLSEAGLEDGAPIEAALPTLHKFCTIPVECESDMFLFQCGVYNISFLDREMFEFEIVRQFCIDAPDDEGNVDYDHMEQLKCSFYFEPTPELRAVCFNHWADEGAPVSTFFAEIESYPIYQVLKRQTPAKFTVAQDWV